MMPRARRASGRRAVGRLLLAAPLALLAGCGGSDDSAPEGASTPGSQNAGGVAAGTGGFAFRDVSAGSGITLANVSGDAARKLAIPENIGQGAAALDTGAGGVVGENGLDHDLVDTALAQDRRPHGRVVLERRMDLPVEVVEQTREPPEIRVLAEPLGVRADGGLDREHVTAESGLLDELVQGFEGAIAVRLTGVPSREEIQKVLEAIDEVSDWEASQAMPAPKPEPEQAKKKEEQKAVESTVRVRTSFLY